jgi:adenylate cyclase
MSDVKSSQRLNMVRKSVVIVDVVESVRLMQENEAETIELWIEYVAKIREIVVDKLNGRLVKSLGDGLLLEFVTVRESTRAAFEIQRLASLLTNTSLRKMQLRVGVHVSELYEDELDVFGIGVNLAARLASLGEPGDIVVSAEIRNELVSDHDAFIEDIGECYLKHVELPVRAFKLFPVGYSNTVAAPDKNRGESLVPSLAVLTLRNLEDSHNVGIVGRLFSDDLNAHLSKNDELRVVSRLSSHSVSRADESVVAIAHTLKVAYIISGSFLVSGKTLIVNLELSESTKGNVVWAERFRMRTSSLVDDSIELSAQASIALQHALEKHEAKRARLIPFPNLPTYAIHTGALTLIHSSSASDFSRARSAFEVVADRAPRNGSPYAWMAKWYCLAVNRGMSTSANQDILKARAFAERALEKDDDNAQAWALRGLVYGFYLKEFGEADASYSASLARNNNEPLAWLYTGTLRAWQERGAEASAAADRALLLSPADPMLYYFQALAATAYMSNDEYEKAILHCRSSLKLNLMHSPTYRMLAISYVLNGQVDDARYVVSKLRAIEPNLTVAGYLSRYPGGVTTRSSKYGQALAEAGLPTK